MRGSLGMGFPAGPPRRDDRGEGRQVQREAVCEAGRGGRRRAGRGASTSAAKPRGSRLVTSPSRIPPLEWHAWSREAQSGGAEGRSRLRPQSVLWDRGGGRALLGPLVAVGSRGRAGAGCEATVRGCGGHVSDFVLMGTALLTRYISRCCWWKGFLLVSSLILSA